jgi:ABC-type lipoprotein export system ATPase subunit
LLVRALRSATFCIEEGEYVALMGASGSGKSTLMNTLGCLDRPSEGSYLLDGQEISTMSRDERATIRNARIGFVFQNFNLLARTPAVENVELPLLYARGISTRERRARAEEMLRKVGLGDRMHHHSGQLSGGQQQRVAIARALINRPKILMGDEPTGNLDSRTTREVLALFRQLNEEQGLTIILVTHDQDVARHARRTIVLRDGRIIADTADIEAAIAALHGSADHDAETEADPDESPGTAGA